MNDGEKGRETQTRVYTTTFNLPIICTIVHEIEVEHREPSRSTCIVRTTDPAIIRLLYNRKKKGGKGTLAVTKTACERAPVAVSIAQHVTHLCDNQSVALEPSKLILPDSTILKRYYSSSSHLGCTPCGRLDPTVFQVLAAARCWTRCLFLSGVLLV